MGCFFWQSARKTLKKKRFFIPTEPLESLEKKGKCTKKQGKGALRPKKFNPDRKFQSWLEIFNPDRKFQSRSKISIPVFLFTGHSWCTEKGSIEKFQSPIDRSKFSIPKAAIEFFQSPDLRVGKKNPRKEKTKKSKKSKERKDRVKGVGPGTRRRGRGSQKFSPRRGGGSLALQREKWNPNSSYCALRPRLFGDYFQDIV